MLEYLAKVVTCVYKIHLVTSMQSMQPYHDAAQWLLQSCSVFCVHQITSPNCSQPSVVLVWLSIALDSLMLYVLYRCIFT